MRRRSRKDGNLSPAVAGLHFLEEASQDARRDQTDHKQSLPHRSVLRRDAGMSRTHRENLLEATRRRGTGAPDQPPTSQHPGHLP